MGFPKPRCSSGEPCPAPTRPTIFQVSQLALPPPGDGRVNNVDQPMPLKRLSRERGAFSYSSADALSWRSRLHPLALCTLLFLAPPLLSGQATPAPRVLAFVNGHWLGPRGFEPRTRY